MSDEAGSSVSYQRRDDLHVHLGMPLLLVDFQFIPFCALELWLFYVGSFRGKFCLLGNNDDDLFSDEAWSGVGHQTWSGLNSLVDIQFIPWRDDLHVHLGMPLFLVDFQFIPFCALELWLSYVGSFRGKFCLLGNNDDDLFSDEAWSGVGHQTWSGLNSLVDIQFIPCSEVELCLSYVGSFRGKFCLLGNNHNNLFSDEAWSGVGHQTWSGINSLVDIQFIPCSARELCLSYVGSFKDELCLLGNNDEDLLSDEAWSGVGHQTWSGLNSLVDIQFIPCSEVELCLSYVGSFRGKFCLLGDNHNDLFSDEAWSGVNSLVDF